MLKTLINILSNTIVRFIPLAASFFLIPVIINYVGIEVYGAWAVLGAFVGMAPVMNMGFGFVLEKEVARLKSRENDPMLVTNFLFSTLPIQFIIAAVIMALFLLVIHGILDITNMSPVLRQSFYNLQYLLLLFLFFKYFSNNFMSIVMGMERHYILMAINFFYMVAYVISVLTILPSHPNLLGLVICNSIAMLTMFVSLLFYILFHLTIDLKKLRFHRLERSIFGYSAHAFTLQLCALLLFNAGKVILGALVSVVEVSYYDVAYKIFDIIRFTFDSMSRVFLPKASGLKEMNKMHILSYLIHRGTLHLVAFWGALSIPIYIFIDDFIAIWMGPDFSKSVAILYVLLATSGFIVLSRISLNVFLGLGKLKWYTFIRTTSTVLYIIIAFFLTKRFGAVGLASSLLIYSVISELLVMIYSFKEFEISMTQFIFKDLTRLGALFIICGSVANYLIYPFLPPSYLSCILIFLIFNTLFGTLYFFIMITSKEKQLARSIMTHCIEITLGTLHKIKEKVIR
ncbi:MAG: hypothetical protein C4541_11315 [Candidatus Auribacter fodinae]|uniref:Uncharacterized protein n=1 Tax=Candidatus Auribacter fodinae TaxID=2093366 RepID=A0A3A4R240_9BACT|nr:MAG: hypothetical protein C4541_11315 [Candidatus Auribacter fodinae]